MESLEQLVQHILIIFKIGQIYQASINDMVTLALISIFLYVQNTVF